MFTISRAGAVSLLIVGGVSVRPQTRQPVRGFTYTMHVSMAPRGEGAAALGDAATQDWTARATSANGRGRLDITSGGAAGMWATGDYLLFDSSEFIIVHPAIKQYIVIPSDLASRGFDQMRANGVEVTISGVTAAMQPIIGDTSVAGHPTKHYQLDVSYSLGMTVGMMQQTISTKVTSDMWLARVAGLPANPFLRASTTRGGGLMQDITHKVDSVSKPIAGLIPLRSVTITELSGAAPTPLTTEQRVEVQDLAPAAVNDDLLYLPADFTAGLLPGLTNVPGDSSAAKWRRPIGAGRQ